MTPRQVNEWKSGIILFAPMIIIILISAFNGVLNMGTACLGAVIGIMCGYIGIFTGVIKK
ncbi:MAG: hypothetical protein WC433_08355 [Candidatus Omnitrophota bacterium]|jgi:hypothetical protein